MCGIAGILKFNNEKVNLHELKRMTDIIHHRGPDGEGHWINSDENVGFGHRRLSIIDLSENGKQPMHYANGRYTITFNGEIYNYLELKKTLADKGYKFFSTSDTEVLLALFDYKKEKCLDDLDGMFSFAIWDEFEQTLFCARDRFGEKPFYYFKDNNHFIFGSEMKELWANGIPKEINPRMLDLYIKTQAVVDDSDYSLTFYKNICQLDAGCYIKIRKDSSEIKQIRYWDLNNIKQIKIDFNEAVRKFYELFKQSILLRLRSDVPFGSSLSGGLDSSSIVLLIDKIKDENTIQKTFSARFKDFSKDEGEHILKVINACNKIESHNIWPNGEEMVEDLDNLFFHQEEPFGTGSVYAQWKVMELAKNNNVIVLLDGQGADEILSGYLTYYSTYLNQLFYNTPEKYKTELNAYNNYHSEVKKIEDFHDSETFQMKIGRVKRKLLSQEMPVLPNELRKRLIFDTQSNGLKTLLRYADRNSMAHSREVRLPFLSHHLVEFIFSLPDEFKLNNGWTKFILRKAMDTALPKEICWRVDKIGYEAPQVNWLKYKNIQDKINSGKHKLNDYLNTKSNLENDWQLLMIEQLL